MWILNEGMLGWSTMALKYAQISWIAVSVIVLFVTIYFFDGEENSDIGVFLACVLPQSELDFSSI